MKLNGAGKGVLALISGTAGAQILTIVALPFLSRLYSPKDFGHYSFVLALAGLAAGLATLRLDAAAMLPSDVHQVRALSWLSIGSTVTVSVALSVALQVLSDAKLFGLHEHPMLAFWVASFTLSGGLYALFSQLSLRQRFYGLVAGRSLLRAAVSATSQVSLGVLPRATNGLLLGGLLGHAAGIARMIGSTRELSALPRARDILPTLRRYWRFPLVFAPSALLNSIGLFAPLLFITTYFGIVAGGQLGMAERVVALPVTVVGAAVGQVIEAEAAKRLRDGRGELRKIYVKLSMLLASVGCCVAIGGVLFGRLVVPWLLGSEWRTAGAMVQILAVNAGIRLVAGPLSKFLVVLQRSLAVTLLDAFRVLVMGLAMWLAIDREVDLTTALWLVYSALSLTYILTWVSGFWCVRDR